MERLQVLAINVQNVTPAIIFLTAKLILNLRNIMNAAACTKEAAVTPKPIFPAEHASMTADNITVVCPAAVPAIPADNIPMHRNANAIPAVIRN